MAFDRRPATVLALLWAALAPLPLAAQETPDSLPNLSPFERLGRLPQDALGIRGPGFIVLPRLTLDLTFDDNIFTDNQAISDFFVSIRPAILVLTTSPVYRFGGQVAADIRRYLDNSEFDRNDFSARFGGAVDIDRRNTVGGSASFERLSEDPDDSDRRVRRGFDVAAVETSYAHRFNRLQLRLTGRIRNTDYRAAENDDLDRTDFQLATRWSYTVSAVLEPYLELLYTYRDFDEPERNTGLTQNYDTIEALAGTRFELGRTIDGDVAVGLTRQAFRDPEFNDDTTAFAARGTVSWAVTPRTVLTGIVRREERPPSESNDSFRISTQFALVARHELRPDWSLRADLSYVNDDFESFNQVDDTVTASIGTEYALTRRVSLFARVRHQNRFSNVESAEFTVNQVTVGVISRF